VAKLLMLQGVQEKVMIKMWKLNLMSRNFKFWEFVKFSPMWGFTLIWNKVVFPCWNYADSIWISKPCVTRKSFFFFKKKKERKERKKKFKVKW
jgi:hypothetical protein